MTSSIFSWKRIRKFFNDIHLWLGIGAGLILFVVCLTGTIYTFRTEIEEWLEPEKYFVEAPANAEPLPAAELISQVESELNVGKVGSITIPADPERAYTLNIKKEGERRGANYYVNPYSGAVTGDGESVASGFFMTVFRLHRWLLLDTEVGRPIVGWATVIFAFLVITGMVIWFPQRIKSWKQGLKIKWNANWKRINHDLHNALGFYASFFLLIMALTGLFWSFDWYRDGLYAVLGVENNRDGGPGEARENAPEAPAGELLSLEELLAVADGELAYTGDYRVSLPNEKQSTVSISKYKTGFFAPAAGDQLSLDPVSGAVTGKEIFAEKPFNQRVARSIKALHVGNVYGTFSKIIYFISCLIATSLPITGTIIWINKLKKKRKRKVKQAGKRAEAVLQ
ncbi:PepSY-associated TM helix domain-containing protein [Flavilitoribacter nigricans]|uniref:Sulfite reductase n=1 Tax=Flavilitoribacter nigricans (strain ATCC 23147 / DSM 23189 / NBRC 102662 / NCIMB 1420 / SS-2) TaxID=1122177 RepID=A0A2D0NEH6_FLAN2|nr:PepSY-associated TM helix domain-containing protein [Flavilitoribacter nigricans]PHN06776.1 sulfite reductase [Flavilitoribacter nigricans DSM 23189 = NBRC 102662]